MKITKVQGRKFERANSNVKGVVEVTLDDCFVIKDIRIIEKPEKMVVAMPSKIIAGRNEDGTISDTIKVHVDQAHPINQETRKMFNDTILGAYERATTNEINEEF